MGRWTANAGAESQYILSGVFGNYEKELENKPTMAVVSGKLPARTVAYTIIDEAYKDKTSPDCTGSVDASGVHGVGKGTPPCTAMLQFRKPKVFLSPVALQPLPSCWGAAL